jgi:Holliday junction resolvase-like predicted endonuclease
MELATADSMMKSKSLSKKHKGHIGEQIAKEFLQNKGFSILSQNFRLPQSTGACEIDIVALNPLSMKLYLTEVKVRGPFQIVPTISFRQYKRISISLQIFKTFFLRPDDLDEQSYEVLCELFEPFFQEDEFRLKGIETQLLKVNPETGNVEVFKNLGFGTGW